MGFAPWMFELPQPSDIAALAQLKDPQGFAATYGPTTAE
jgi:mannosylglycerate hydrolase MGH1-like protein